MVLRAAAAGWRIGEVAGLLPAARRGPLEGLAAASAEPGAPSATWGRCCDEQPSSDAAVARAARASRRPGPFRPTFWRSPLRGPWLTSFLGTLLGPLIVVIAFTGLISHDSYYPELGNNATDQPGARHRRRCSTSRSGPPIWSYALTQGLHITIGLITIPVLLAKLWSVIPRLFAWPAVRNLAQRARAASLLLLVGGALFEFATGVLNIQNYYPWHFDFVHGALLRGVGVLRRVRAPRLREAAGRRPGLPGAGVAAAAARRPAAHACRADVAGGLAPVAPAAPTLSRRGFLGLVGGASLTLFALNIGETVGGPLRRLALLAPRGRVFGTGPNDFQVNRTAASVGVTPALIGCDLAADGERAQRKTVSLSRAQLMAMPQHTVRAADRVRRGLVDDAALDGRAGRDLAALVGAPADARSCTSSRSSRAARSATPTCPPRSYATSATLLALCVNGVDLSRDHGYPARLILPAQPGVHCTKWVGSMSFDVQA